MREINLAAVAYQLAPGSRIIKRAVNPFKGRLGSSGSLEYSDFSSASIEEYHDFRNGIGRDRGVGSDARLKWSEGIDFTVDGQATLGSLVTTADYATWAASTAYTAGAGSALFSFVIPTTANGYCYECTTAGTSHTAEPVTWGTTPGGTTSEGGGTVVWTCRAYLAPIKIIDFQSKTYFIKNSRIEKWNTTTSKLECVDNTFASPIDAIVVTDSTDEYLVVSSAYAAIYTTDGTTWANLCDILTDYTEVDANSKLTVTATRATAVDVDGDEDVYLYRDMGAGFFNTLSVDFEILINATSGINAEAGMAITNTVNDMSGFATTDISVFIEESAGPVYKIYLYRGNKVANDSYTCSTDTLYYCTIERVASNDTVNLKIYSDLARATLVDTLTVSGFSTTTYRYLFAFVNNNTATVAQDFDGYVQNVRRRKGYLADYINRLYSISTDGKTVYLSASKNIDTYADEFNLTGNYGTLYDLFEGKLLADGTPTLYFTGTQGLFSLDTTNEIAYQQEVSYPSLTYAGHKGMYWNANVWVATGYGILKVSSSVATEIGPNLDDGLPSGSQGYIYDMIPVNNWLVYCVNGGTTDESSILKRNSSYGGSLQVYTTAAVNNPIACMWHSPSSLYTNGRLWFGEGTGVKYMMFPDTTSNPKQIATYTYVNDSGYGTLPIFRKLAAIGKTALGMAAITKSCDANEYVQVYYGLNGAAATTSLGTYKTSPRATILTFGSGLGTAFYTIQFAVKLYRGDTTTNSPELESLMFYYYPTPTRISAWTFKIQATEDTSDAIIAAFETIMDTGTLVAFYPTGDTAKTSYNVKLTSLSELIWVENQGTRQGYLEVTVEQVFSG